MKLQVSKNMILLILILIGGLLLMQHFGIENNSSNKNPKTIYLAGGCFWGVEAYFSRMPGILSTISGYANGKTEDPTYQEVSTGETGYAETIFIEYDSSIISLDEILEHYFSIIDPTSLNKQGNDIGTQYRTGIYYTDDDDYPVIMHIFKNEEIICDFTVDVTDSIYDLCIHSL